MTIAEAKAEILLRLYKGKPSDDIQIGDRQLSLWLSKHKNALLVDHIRKNGGDVPASSAKRYECNAVKIETPVCVTEGCYSHYYLDLPVPVLSLNNDTGIHRMLTQAGEEYLRFHAGAQNILKHLKYSAPSNDRPGWFRIEDKIYLIGDGLEGRLFAMDLVVSDISNYDDNDTFPLPSGLMAVLIDMCVNDGAQQLQTVNDLKDDGKE